MSYRIVFLEAANCDMDLVEEYLSQFYAGTVSNFFLKLEKQVAVLAEMPYLYQAYEEDPFFRRMVIDDYLLFYSVDEKRQLVVIHRIFHASKDILREMLS